MKKKIISVLAVVVMLVFACGTAFSAEFSIDLKGIKDTIKKDVKNAKSGKSSESTTGTAKAAAINTEPNSEDDFDWKVNDDFTEITITKYKGTRTDVVIPATIQDVPVTRIGVEAFKDAKITSVVIPKGVKKIERNAFYCRSSILTSVTLPENVVIGSGAFSYCDSLQSIEIPKDCTLKEKAFSGCDKLESVTLPEGLKIIPDSCFSGCFKLVNINFPSTLKYIGSWAFTGDHVSIAGKWTFRGCPLAALDFPEGLEFIGYKAFYTPIASTSLSLPKSLKWVCLDNAYRDGTTDYPTIYGDNINAITIAEGCAPKVIFRGENKDSLDARDIIKGASIDKSLKLQKQLAALKLTKADKIDTRYDSTYAKNGSVKYKGKTYYFISETSKALYDDLLKYGFSEEEAYSLIGQIENN